MYIPTKTQCYDRRNLWITPQSTIIFHARGATNVICIKKLSQDTTHVDNLISLHIFCMLCLICPYQGKVTHRLVLLVHLSCFVRKFICFVHFLTNLRTKWKKNWQIFLQTSSCLPLILTNVYDYRQYFQLMSLFHKIYRFSSSILLMQTKFSQHILMTLNLFLFLSMCREKSFIVYFLKKKMSLKGCLDHGPL